MIAMEAIILQAWNRSKIHLSQECTFLRASRLMVNLRREFEELPMRSTGGSFARVARHMALKVLWISIKRTKVTFLTVSWKFKTMMEWCSIELFDTENQPPYMKADKHTILMSTSQLLCYLARTVWPSPITFRAMWCSKKVDFKTNCKGLFHKKSKIIAPQNPITSQRCKYARSAVIKVMINEHDRVFHGLFLCKRE